MENLVRSTGDFWSQQKVFLTGHTGFKGSWLALWLQKLGATVYGYSLPPEKDQSLFHLARVAEGMSSEFGDIRDSEKLRKSLNSSKANIVIHMAAQPIVRRSYVDPVETYSTNVMGLVNLFEAVRGSDAVKSVLNITSDKCYENKEQVWGYREKDPMGGHDPYSNSKACSELITSAYKNSFFSENPSSGRKNAVIASCRSGNVVGGGDWSDDRLVPDLVKAFLRNEVAEIRNPNSVRPWQHVLEPLSGYMTLAERTLLYGERYSGPWNFGPLTHMRYTVSEFAQKFTSSWSKNAKCKVKPDDGPHEAQLLSLDCAKANTELDWLPKMDFRETIQYTVDWYKAHQKGADMRLVCFDQIDTYMRKGVQYE